MTQVLTEFIRALRASDVRVSTAESIDAAATIDQMGFDDRGLLKESLSQVLAKTADDKLRFADCFERFFFAEDMRGIDSPYVDDDEEDFEKPALDDHLEHIPFQHEILPENEMITRSAKFYSTMDKRRTLRFLLLHTLDYQSLCF